MGMETKAITWTTDPPTEPGWYWVRGEEFLLICQIYQRFSDQVLMVENFDFEDGPLSGLSFGIEFQPVKPPED